MPYTVLKQSKTSADGTEVVGEFASEREAYDFAENAKIDENNKDCEFLVECPPPKTEQNTSH